jgi:ADP-heptose:LPS heptosyltransferase
MKLKLAEFYQHTRSASKIIVVDLGFLGDSVHLIPSLYEIKRHYPEAQLHTLSATSGAELLNLVPCVDSAWAFPLTAKSPPWWRHWDIIGGLRREQFDLAFNFSGADRTLFLAALTRAKWRLARESGRRHFWSSWLIDTVAPRQGRDLPMFEQRLQVLAAAGFSLSSPNFALQISEKARQSAAANIPANSIHLSINASAPAKEWPLENWIELVKLYLAGDPQVQLVATAAANPRELKRLHLLAAAVPDSRLLCLEGLNLSQLAALLQRCRLHLGADSGVLHLAAALGLTTFTVFRKYEGLKEWLPTGAQHKYLVAACPCCNDRRDRCSRKGKSACLATISATQVYEESRSLRPISLKNL